MGSVSRPPSVTGSGGHRLGTGTQVSRPWGLLCSGNRFVSIEPSQPFAMGTRLGVRVLHLCLARSSSPTQGDVCEWHQM